MGANLVIGSPNVLGFISQKSGLPITKYAFPEHLDSQLWMVMFRLVWSNKKIFIPTSFLQVRESSSWPHCRLQYGSMWEFKNILLGLMDLDFFDNPTVKKVIAVMFWVLAIFPITKNCQTFGRWIPEHLDSQLPSMHQREERKIIAH